MSKILLILIAALLLVTGCVAGTAADPVNADLVDGDKVIINGKSGTFEQDAVSMALVTITNDHKELHEGSSFIVAKVTDLGNGANITFLLVTPNTTKWAHVLWQVQHEAETAVTFYEGVTYSNNGTALPGVNRNRNSTMAATTLTYHTPTITNYGTEIEPHQGGSGKSDGGENRGTNEYILKQNTAYALVIDNKTVSANLISSIIDWYEHTSGN